MGNRYFRRTERPEGLRARLGGKHWYEVWQPDGPPQAMSMADLDRLLDGRAMPGDYWTAVRVADEAHARGDRAWVESSTGILLRDPPGDGGRYQSPS